MFQKDRHPSGTFWNIRYALGTRLEPSGTFDTCIGMPCIGMPPPIIWSGMLSLAFISCESSPASTMFSAQILSHRSWICRKGSGSRVQGSGFRVQGSGFRVQGAGFRVQGSMGQMVLLGAGRFLPEMCTFRSVIATPECWRG